MVDLSVIAYYGMTPGAWGLHARQADKRYVLEYQEDPWFYHYYIHDNPEKYFDTKKFMEDPEKYNEELREEIRRLISDPDAYTIECVASTDEEIRECLGGEQ